MPLTIPFQTGTAQAPNGASAPISPAVAGGSEDQAFTGGLAGDPGNYASVTPDMTAFGWLLAWIVVILLLWAITQTKAGYSLVYYLLWAALVILLLTQYQWIVAALYPLSGVIVKQQQPAS